MHEKTQELKNRILSFIQSRTPIKESGRTFEIKDLTVTEPSALHDLKEQMNMKYSGKGELMGWVRGRMVVTDDQHGTTLVNGRSINILPVYYLTDRGTYLINGSEKTVLNEMRGKSGVYTEKVLGTNNVKTQILFNNMNQKNNYIPPIFLVFDGTEVSFTVNINGFNKFSMNGIVFLRELGFMDPEIARIIGNDYIYDTLVKSAKSKRTIFDIYRGITNKAASGTPVQIREELYKYLEEHANFGPDGNRVLRTTIGLDTKKFSKDLVAASVKKLFDVSKGLVKEDDREDLRFKDIIDENEMIMEKVEAEWDLFHDKVVENLKKKDINYTDFKAMKMGEGIQEFFSDNPLVQDTEEINPLFIASVNNKITQIGSTGGLSTENMSGIKRPRVLKTMGENRIDPVETPESGSIGLVEHLTQASLIKNKTIYIPLLKVKNGVASDEKVQVDPHDEYNMKVAFYDTRYMKKEGNRIVFTKDLIPARYQGKTTMRHISEITHVDPAPQNLFNYTANSIPFVHHNDGNRALMGTNMQRQAINIKNRELPLVSAVNQEGKTYEEVVGNLQSKVVKSTVDGVVESVDFDNSVINVRGNSGIVKHNFYHYFPLNQSYMHNEVKVKKGDSVKKGQILADGWQSRDGALALGLNARVGFMPYKGYNYEDGIVISESFADKMSHEELYNIDIEIRKDSDGGIGSNVIQKLRYETTEAEVFNNLDRDGIIKVGTKVKPGSLLAAWMAPIKENEHNINLLSLFSSSKSTKSKAVYKRIDPGSFVEGEVIRITKVDNPDGENKQKIIITVLKTKKMGLGDKMSGKHGNKGTITKIVPDDEMPMAEDGKALDVIFSPLAIPSRKNVGQLLELHSGLIAEKTGKRVLVNNFDHTEKDKVINGLKEIGFPDGKMNVFLREKDESGKIINVPLENKVTVGNMYVLKLKHKVDDKIQGRSNMETAPGMKSMMPSKQLGQKQGEKHNPQSFGEMEMRGMQAHGTVWNILESSTIKADGGGDSAQRTAIFNAIATGKFDNLEAPGTPESLKTLSDQLRVLGLKVQPINHGLNARSLDHAFDSLSLIPIKPSEMEKIIGKKNEVVAPFGKDARPGEDIAVEGGLMDPNIFGEEGDEEARKKWGMIKLFTPMPNPVFAFNTSHNPYSILTGYENKKLLSMVKGKGVLIIDPDQYDGFSDAKQKALMVPQIKKAMMDAGLRPGDIVMPEVLEKKIDEHGEILWKTGGEAIHYMLDSIDVDAELKKVKEELKNAKEDKLDKEYKKYKVLMMLKNNNMKPSDLMMQSIPVAPTYMRPVIESGKTRIVDDMNKLYSNIINSNNASKRRVENGFDLQSDLNPTEAAKSTGTLFRQISNLSGNTVFRDPMKKKELKGLKDEIGGKHGIVRDKMLSKRLDFSGRSVIGVNPMLDTDEADIPFEMAKQLYKPFIFKELVRRGYAADIADAQEKFDEMGKDLRPIVQSIANERPVILNRQPSLHKFSLLSMKPNITFGRNINLNPMVVTGFNADFDGDSCLNSVFARFKEIDIESKDCYNSDRGDEKMPFSKETKIRYRYGIVNLGDFPRLDLKESKGNKEIYSVPEDIEVLTVWNGEEQWLPVESFSVHKDLKMIEVETNTSRTIQCSDDHSLVTVDDELNYVRAAAKNGMTIPRIRKPVKDSVELIDSISLPVAEEQQYLFQDQIPLDFEFGYVNGVHVGDGWTNLNEKNWTAICLASEARYIPNKIKEVISKYANIEVNICSVPAPHTFEGRESYCEKHTWYSSRFATYFKKYIGHGAKNKVLPSFWMQSPESFRWGLLSGLIDTDGSISSNTAKKTRSRDQIIINYTTISRALSYDIVALAHSLDLTASVCVTQTPKGNPCYVVVFTQESIDMMQKKLLLMTPSKASMLSHYKPNETYKRNKYTPKLSKDRLSELRKIIRTSRYQYKEGEAKNESMLKKVDSIYAVISRILSQDTAFTRQTALDIFELNFPIFENDEFWKKWKSMVLNEEIEWEMITEIRAIPFITEAYDLTIPPAYTMVTESGIVVYDTMSAHVPITDKANEEAKRLMRPSSNLINPTNGQLMLEIRHEMIMGIYYLTMDYNKGIGKVRFYNDYKKLREDYRKAIINARDMVSYIGKTATAGQVMFNALLPIKYRNYEQAWDSKKVKNLISVMYTDCEKSNGKDISTQQIVHIIDQMKKLGFEASTRSGISLSVTDFKKFEDADKIINKHITEAKKEIDDPEEALIIGYRNAEIEIEKQLSSGKILEKDNPLNIMMVSGSRAKADQIRRMSVTVGVGKDITDRLTLPVLHSNLDGLATHEFWNHSNDARKGLFDRSVSTATPGALSREVWSGTQDILVRAKDCGTTEGIEIRKNSKTIVGRFASKDIAGIVKKNEMITIDKKDKLYEDEDIENVWVRSPLKCRTVGGVCQMCYGAMPGTTTLPEIGTAVGVIASQALGEPVTQMTMKTFHSGGTDSSASLGAPRISQLLNLSAAPGVEASLAKTSGKVTEIFKGTPGTYDVVVINKMKHVIPHLYSGKSKPIKVEVGDTISKGDFLTFGDVGDIKSNKKIIITSADPRELFKLKSEAEGQTAAWNYAQNYLVGSMEDVFSKTIGDDQIDRRHLETIVGKMTSKVKVLNPGDSNYTRGSFADKNAIEAWNRMNTGVANIRMFPLTPKLEGKICGENYNGKNGESIIRKNDIFSQEKIQKLIFSGKKEVRVIPSPIKYKIELSSKQQMVTRGHDNWFSNIGTQDVYKQLASGAAYGQVDKLNTPSARLMTGKLLNIGEGTKVEKDKANSLTTKIKHLFGF